MNVLTVFVELEYFMLETPICLLYVCFKDCKAPRGRFLTFSNINKTNLMLSLGVIFYARHWFHNVVRATDIFSNM